LAIIVCLAIFDPNARTASVAFPAIVFGIVFLAHFITAKGARQSKPWARTASIVISVLLLLGFPVGTLIGIYLLANTWSPWPQPGADGVVA
jgi:hypothetical protein